MPNYQPQKGKTMTTKNAAKAAAATDAEVCDPLDADFTWLQTATPGPVAELHAALITELSGVEITPQQVRAVLSMHGKIQASEANRKRAGYKPRTAQSIRKGGETTVEHMDVRLAAVAEVEASAKPKAPRKPRARKAQAEAPAAATEVAEVAVAS